jgi:hypothetical protein
MIHMSGPWEGGRGTLVTRLVHVIGERTEGGGNKKCQNISTPCLKTPSPPSPPPRMGWGCPTPASLRHLRGSRGGLTASFPSPTRLPCHGQRTPSASRATRSGDIASDLSKTFETRLSKILGTSRHLGSRGLLSRLRSPTHTRIAATRTHTRYKHEPAREGTVQHHPRFPSSTRLSRSLVDGFTTQIIPLERGQKQ